VAGSKDRLSLICGDGMAKSACPQRVNIGRLIPIGAYSIMSWGTASARRSAVAVGPVAVEALPNWIFLLWGGKRN